MHISTIYKTSILIRGAPLSFKIVNASAISYLTAEDTAGGRPTLKFVGRNIREERCGWLSGFPLSH